MSRLIKRSIENADGTITTPGMMKTDNTKRWEAFDKKVLRYKKPFEAKTILRKKSES